MKTLHQRIETQLDSNLSLSHDFNKIEKEFLRLTKEWVSELRECPPEPLTEKQIKFYYRIFDYILRSISQEPIKEEK